jgi:hypothetical protein
MWMFTEPENYYREYQNFSLENYYREYKIFSRDSLDY